MKRFLKRIGHFLLRLLATVASGFLVFLIILIIGAATQVTAYGLLAAILFILLLFGLPLLVMFFTFVLFPPLRPNVKHNSFSDVDSDFAHVDASYDDNPCGIAEDDVVIASPEDWLHFLETHEPIREIRTKVAGATFRNDDGSSRQEILSLCHDGDMLDLEYFTHQGEPAYKVFSRYGQIGNLPAEDAMLIDSVYGEYVTGAVISKVTGGNGYYYGCNILLTIYTKKQ